MQILNAYEKIEKILGRNPVQKIQKVNSEVKTFKNRYEDVRRRQQKCLDAYKRTIENLYTEIVEIGLLKKNREKESLIVREMELFTDVLALKKTRIHQRMEKDLYNQKTIPALRFIRSELESMIEQQEDLKYILKARIGKFESNPQMKALREEYSKCLRTIQMKKIQIENINS